MLIYNHNKEFIGIDAEDLEQLGYKSLSSFFDDYNDFSDLFVKKPGFIHNFKNFPWIDFVLYAEAEESKAIIKTTSKEFTCDLVVTSFFLANASNQEGYAVSLKHIRNVSGGTAPSPADEPAPNNERVVLDMDMDDDFGISSFDSHDSTVLNEPDLLDIPDLEMPPIGSSYDDTELTFPGLDDTFTTPEKSTFSAQSSTGSSINRNEASYLEKLQTASDYVYNPQIASDELGLPVDLIEEFIGDFIQQSYEFKDQLFDVTLKEDYDEVHALSHKLKGVAANLRIEDSFEVLNIINNSRDQTEIEANLKQFYRLLAKLEGKELPEFDVTETQEEENSHDSFEDDIYDFDLLLDPKPTPIPKAPEAKEEVVDFLEDDLFLEAEPTPKPKEVDDFLDDDLFAEPDLMPEIEPLPIPEPITVSEPAPTPKVAEVKEEVIDFVEDDLFLEPEPTPKPKEVNDFLDDDFLLEPEPMPEAEATPTSKPIAVPEPAPIPEASIKATLNYDAKSASNELGLSYEFVTELIEDFTTESKEFHTEFNEAIKNEDYHLLRELASELKGATDNLRITDLSAVLQNLIHIDNTTAANKTVNELYDLIDQL
ncbi:MAG: hypothetical protein DRG24_08715 [Epsilonproteobacteria bacterium]|nr:MAG: hypothetical protein DRG24_08715 [Campylobacterota bacterium]